MALVVSSLNGTYWNVYKQRLKDLKFQKVPLINIGHWGIVMTTLLHEPWFMEKSLCPQDITLSLINIKIAEDTGNEDMKRWKGRRGNSRGIEHIWTKLDAGLNTSSVFPHSPVMEISMYFLKVKKRFTKDSVDIWASKIYTGFTLDCLIIFIYKIYRQTTTY